MLDPEFWVSLLSKNVDMDFDIMFSFLLTSENVNI